MRNPLHIRLILTSSDGRTDFEVVNSWRHAMRYFPTNGKVFIRTGTYGTHAIVVVQYGG